MSFSYKDFKIKLLFIQMNQNLFSNLKLRILSQKTLRDKILVYLYSIKPDENLTTFSWAYGLLYYFHNIYTLQSCLLYIIYTIYYFLLICACNFKNAWYNELIKTNKAKNQRKEGTDHQKINKHSF